MAKPSVAKVLKLFDFKAAAEDGSRVFFMSETQQAALAEKLNIVINIPGFNDEQERQIILKVVQSLDRNTFRFIPREVLEIAHNPKEGVPAAVLEALRDSLPLLLAQAIPLPFLPPFVKQAIIGAFVTQLLSALREGRSLAGEPA